MKNKNESISPIIIPNSGSHYSDGLTKREHAAIHILSNLMSDLRRLEEDGPNSAEDLVQMAVNAADLLFNKLEE